MFPTLHPEHKWYDTGGLHVYKLESEDRTTRTVSIGRSWTRKALSSVRVYAEQRDLIFFLYEKQMAMKFFAAHSRAQTSGVTADVMMRDSQASAGYWEIVRDSLADLVRIQLSRCYDEKNHKPLFDHVRGLRGQVWLCAFPKSLHHDCPRGVDISSAVFSRTLPRLCLRWCLSHGFAYVLSRALYVGLSCESFRMQMVCGVRVCDEN